MEEECQCQRRRWTVGGSKSKLDALLFKVEEGCEDGDNALLSHGSRSVEIFSNRNGKMQTQTQTQMQTQMHNAGCKMSLAYR